MNMSTEDPARSDDPEVASPEAVVWALYDVISGPADHERDWDRLRGLFQEDARIMVFASSLDGTDESAGWSVEEFVAQAREEYREEGFWEREIPASRTPSRRGGASTASRRFAVEAGGGSPTSFSTSNSPTTPFPRPTFRPPKRGGTRAPWRTEAWNGRTAHRPPSDRASWETEGFSFQLIDPSTLDLPMPGRGVSDDATLIQEAVAGATGIVLATPEYHGSFSSVMKLVIENLGFPSRLSGKPVALLGVAGGSIGAIKSLEQLRGVCSHVGAVVLPGPVSVANVRSVFDGDGNCLDVAVERRVRSVAESLTGYIRAAVCPARSLEAMVREAAV